jgi:hypothetical protein
MTNHNNWRDYLTNLLTRNGQFKLIDTNQKNQTTLEFYQQQLGDRKTQIKIGYLGDGRLITLDIANPASVPADEYLSTFVLNFLNIFSISSGSR